MIKNTKKKGFTLVELLVVLTIMGIIIAIAVPSFINYWRSAEFRKNESNAKTIYLAAESKLTYYRSSGQWEKFKKQVKAKGESASFFKEDDAKLNGRIYAITLDSNEYKDTDKKNNLVLQLLDDYIYDKDILKGSIGIEIDIETGEVYSAFYGTKCKGLTYKDDDENGYLTMQKRSYGSRRKRLLGYYSTEDTTNVVKLKPTKLRITTISLQNSEKLTLNWSSNIGQTSDVNYELTFYNKNNDTKLFSMVISPYDLSTEGWNPTSDGIANQALVEVKNKDGNKTQGKWSFPITYSDNKYSLVLDAMMSAKVQAAINQQSESDKIALERTSSTSIRRLSAINASLANELNMYATVQAVPYTGNNSQNNTDNYRESEVAKSNSANTMYADNTSGSNVKISTFRHLSNIRYYNKETTATGTTTFTLTNKNMNWTAVGTGMYDFTTDTKRNTSIQYIKWKDSTKSKPLDFPTIATFDESYKLEGKGNQTVISNLHLGAESIVSGTNYLGLFGEVSGGIEQLTFKDATLQFVRDEDANATQQTSYDNVKDDVMAVGILAGRSNGTLSDITIESTNTDSTKVEATLVNTNQAAVGGVVGVLADKNNANLTSFTGSMSKVTMNGTVTATIPSGQDSEIQGRLPYGIGGIIGYATMNTGSTNAQAISECINHAAVSGNICSGGIAGKVNGAFPYKNVPSENLENYADIKDSTNDGLILCTSDNGKYFGGIIGCGNQTLIHNSTSASGRADNFSYVNADGTPKTNLLKGNYVGGIIGFGTNTLVNSCSTETNGYILGDQYVGGIAGALTGMENTGAIQAISSKINVTTNASYVIGNQYVGGIVGENKSDVTLQNCINNGVAAGYVKYVGGIVGYNNTNATIQDCASYLSDYDNSIFNMITTQWDATADYAGGIAGYNNGAINFSENSEAITVKSISSIVVGKDYVGGITGFNDIKGTLDVHYTLIGGRIYGHDCVGGAFGFNASASLLQKELTIKPRSVEGNYYVGGCIGANVVHLENSSDATMGNFRSDNILGRIKGEAFVGGIIGYQRTYGSGQVSAGTNGFIRDKVERMQAATSKSRLLPDLTANNVPGSVLESQESNTLIITTSENNVDTNNIPIQGNIYVGGIVGYCDKSSKLKIVNCKNSGNISRLLTGTNEKTVKMGDYINAEVSSTTAGNLSDEASNLQLHLVGGIISANLKNQVIENCSNSGSMSGYSGIGGVVGLNAGRISDCTLREHFGNAALNYLGGIAGINVGDENAKGTIENCSTVSQKTISGKDTIGGIVGWNLQNGVLNKDTSYANITASGDNIGGLAGRNSGNIIIGNDTNTKRNISSASGRNVGGLIGINESQGTIELTPTNATNTEVIAVGENVSVNGYERVGGIVGVNYGVLGNTNQNISMVCAARQVRASHGTAGGIVGLTNGDIYKAFNKSTLVTADAGLAGGITAANSEGHTISGCINYGNVSSSNGYAGGIAATNAGIIQNCTVENASTTSGSVVIYSLGVDEAGAITAINSGTIRNSTIKEKKDVTLRGDATKFGGITGKNTGTVTGIATTNGTNTTMTATEVKTLPVIDSTRSNLTVGGAVGENLGEVSYVDGIELEFNNFSGYQYLGGIVGVNGSKENDVDKTKVSNCSYSGTMSEQTSAAGNSYGGIAGINYATLKDNSVGQITMTIKGVYTATSTSTEEQKESLASYAGGITGKNESDAVIDGCTLQNFSTSTLTAENGMLGGIVGFNKGMIQMSGSSVTAAVMEGADDVEKLAENATDENKGNLKADTAYLEWNTNENLDTLKYADNSGNTVSTNRLQMVMLTNGSLGGITAYNGKSGEVNRCVSGNWYLKNKSEAIGVGTGGIIGMNESAKDLSYLVNGAFVGRQVAKPDRAEGQTNRFAGGIIGNQNNATQSDWKIQNCINYGTIYCYRTHYSGGIMGQWTGTGGTIQDCRNYGNLQTTFASDWNGAAAGIVAQLYHAYENNEYNIIRCGNYGSVYTRNGRDDYKNDSRQEGANDSAGILGNITTYYADSVENAQSFTVQILDCINAPGVEIYSYSMASGIFGFLSSDNPNISNIVNSTEKVLIRIERCNNYAKVLKGWNYTAGIFGDRYGENAWRNYTIVKDNNSLNLGEDNYYGRQGGSGFPIYSRGNTNNTAKGGGVAYMLPENRRGNYHLEGIDTWGYTAVRIKESEDTETKEAGSGKAGNGYVEADLKERYTHNGFIMYDLTKKQYFVAVIKTRVNKNAPNTIVDGANQYIDKNGFIVTKDGTKTAEILYYFDNNTTEYDNTWLYKEVIVDPDNAAFLSAHNCWRRLEGIDKNANGENQIRKPKSAEAEISNGKIELNIIPQEIENAWFDTTYDSERLCDPFAYEIRVEKDGKEVTTHMLYSETGSFSIPKNVSSSNAKIYVRSVSMYDDVQPSDWMEVKSTDINKILPDPDVKIELIADNSATNGHTYRYTLNNLDEYNATDEDGNVIYPDWQVTINVNRVGKVVLDANNPTKTMPVSDLNNYVYQMTAQASVKSGGTSMAESSKEVSTAVSLPAYRAPITLRGWTPMLTQSATISGDTLDDLKVTVELDAGSNKMDTPPIYRVELIGTWKGQNEVVFAEKDVLIVSAGKASATFINLPDYIRDATNIKARIWYAASGLGPVYTYYDVAVGSSDANVKELTGVDENGTPTWKYKHSTVLQDNSGYFTNYYNSTNELWTWLAAPKINNTGTTLDPTIDASGNMNYTFSWDDNVGATQSAKYKVSLTGIDADGREVTIDTKNAYTNSSAKTMTINGSDWNYKEVRLKVTRIGDASSKKIGLSSTGTFQVKQRLEQPGQPVVENIDENELNYNISWSPISSENGCKGYQAYIQTYSTTGTLGSAVTLGDLIPVTAIKDGKYSMTMDMEAYAGKRVVIYLVAVADSNANYLDSIDGVTYELKIPSRIDAPKVTWSVNWSYNKDKAIEAKDFKSGGLKVDLTADRGSIPPGGSAYLLKAYVYDSKAEAEAATMSNKGSYLVEYPGGNVPIQMDVKSSQEYSHTIKNLSIKYAGKWIVFYARISSGGGNVSSRWAKSENAYQLPYVKLAEPDITSEQVSSKDEGKESEKLDVLVQDKPDLGEQPATWDATRTHLIWDSVEQANVYALKLKGSVTDTSASSGKKDIEAQIRIIEKTDKTVDVQKYVQQKKENSDELEWVWKSVTEEKADYDENTPETDKIHTFKLDNYKVTISSIYSGEKTYTLTLMAELQIQLKADGSFHYTLKLPDVTDVEAQDGTEVTNSDFAMTTSAIFTSDVEENISGSSDAYQKSEEYEIKWNK